MATEKGLEAERQPLIVLLGPTAVGKTDLSLDLCQQFQGEIICADSRQIYRGMDIGTAKPTPQERARVPHHLFDIRTPAEALSVSEYQELAYRTIDDVHARKRVPFLVGGSPLYIRAVVEGLRIPEVPPDPALRAELEAYAEQQGWEALFRRLQRLDPATAARTDPKNVRRVVRALEIVMTTGRSKTELEGSDPPPYHILQVGLDRPRDALYARIDQRVEQMVARGLLDETRRLLDAGYDASLPAMSSLGYREMIAHLHGGMTLEEAMQKIKTETHRYARHQYTWFRRMRRIVWFDMQQAPQDEMAGRIAEFL
jgi:tRNA dimethylallyltransferase